MRVTRVRRTRYLAAAAPGSSRNGCSVRLTASREGRFLYGESTSPASPGLVWLTVTEVTGPQAVREAAALVAELARGRSQGAGLCQEPRCRRFAGRVRPLSGTRFRKCRRPNYRE